MKTTTKNVMPLVKSVVHPTDFSSASARAFAHALAIALLRQTTLTILHVGSERGYDVPWTSYPSIRPTLERWGFLEAGSPQSAVFEQLRVKVSKIALQSNHPVLAIANYLSKEPTDLIVLATEGLEKKINWSNRSTAEAIARCSRTMTLFIRANAKRNLVSLDDGQWGLKNILVPVDSQPDYTAAIELARRTAQIVGERKVSITLLHVGSSPMVIPKLEEGPEWTWQVENLTGDPVKEILSAADRHVADLIVMATAGHNSVLDVLRGSTTEQVLREAPCPLLAVPAHSQF